MPAYERFLQDKIREGSLTIVEPDGSRSTFGNGTPNAVMNLRKKNTLAKILKNPHLNLGETYMNEAWDVDDHDLASLLNLLRSNFDGGVRQKVPMRALLVLLQSWNTLSASLSNVTHHYNLEDDLFFGFLDEDLHYSCAYFTEENESLEAAQQAKCRHLLKKLRLKPGARVLDIGSGWGSLAMYLAEHAQVDVTGLTLSTSQLRVAEERAKARNLHNQVSFKLEDYRQHTGVYDAIVSVGMFEHVGKPNFQTYFNRVRDLLKPDGVAVVHTIGQYSEPAPTNPWIAKYIFPGGYIPSMSEVMAPIENSGLVTSDVEVWRRHYSKTLEHWFSRFQLLRDGFVKKSGEKFCRMWEFYLAACQTAFETGPLVVFQFQLAKQNDTVPLTRDYLS